MQGIDSQFWSLIGVPLLIFLARAFDVSLGTIRIILVSRGIRRLAPLIGFFEILVWLIAISQIVQNLDRPAHYIAYAGGFAAGTWIGLLVEDKMALGLQAVRIISPDDATDLVERIRELDFGVTSFGARGIKGKVRLILTVIRKRDLSRLQAIVKELHPDAFVTVSDVRLASLGHFPSGAHGFRGQPEQSKKE